MNIFSVAAPINNGGKTDKYSWTQTLGELSVSVPIPADVKSKFIDIEFTSDTLKVAVKGRPGAIISGKLHKRIKVDDCTWTIEEDDELGRCAVLEMTKENRMEWWKCIMEGDTAIDTSKIVPENSKLGDLDGETRSTVEKMMVSIGHVVSLSSLCTFLFHCNLHMYDHRCYSSISDRRRQVCLQVMNSRSRKC